jgi:polysaccharide export outer membrane protein
MSGEVICGKLVKKKHRKMKIKQRLGEGKVEGFGTNRLSNNRSTMLRKIWGIGRLAMVMLILMLVGSCGNMKRVAYFNGVKDSTVFDSLQAHTLLIEPGAQLSIQISSLNSDIDLLINKSNLPSVQGISSSGLGSVGGGLTTGGYYVNDSGYLKLPRLGKINVEGWTMGQLEDTLESRYSLYTKNPLVTVRMLNFMVTLLGEVGRTGPLNITSDRADLLQVLGITGDISAYGKRNNVSIIRKTNNGRILRKLDLTKADFITSEFFYVKPGDVIYVEPNLARKFNATLTSQFMPIVISTTSFILVLYNVILAQK